MTTVPDGNSMASEIDSDSLSEMPPAIPSSATWLTWLQLVRLPTVFTALSNILCGYLMTHHVALADLPSERSMWLLLVASMGLYLGGMVWNDVFDARLDAVERPERPIPSGRISRRAAQRLGSGLMLVGLTSAAAVGQASLIIAVAILLAVFAYNAWLKNTVGGPVGMAVCRLLNLMLGASALATWSDVWSQPQFGIAIGLAVYVAGVTWYARDESGVSRAGALILATCTVLLGIGIMALMVEMSDIRPAGGRGAEVGYLLIAVHLLVRSALTIRNSSPRHVQRMIGLYLLTLIFLDSITVFAWTADARLAALVALLVIPARLMRRWIPLS